MFNFAVDETQTQAELLRESWRRSQCSACAICPMVPPAKPTKDFDILLVTSPDKKAKKNGEKDQICVPIGQHLYGQNYLQVSLIECAYLVDEHQIANEQVKESCFGRKLDLIKRSKPKIILCQGPLAFMTFEKYLGFKGDVFADFVPMPAKFFDTDCWIMQIPTFGIGTSTYNVQNFKNIISHCLSTPPVVMDGNFNGLEIVSNMREVRAAFKDLKTFDLVSHDIETNALRPYFDNAKILSVALGNFDKIYGIPIMHPQTPSGIDPVEIFDLMDDLNKTTRQLAFASSFELEWWCHFLGIQFLKPHLWEDAQVQTYVLRTKPYSLSLDNAIRRTAGFELKSLTNVNRAELEHEAIENVLVYNCGDTKWTDWLYRQQYELIQKKGLTGIYQRRLENVWAHVGMSKRGLDIDWAFHEDQRKRINNLADEYSNQFRIIPEVQAYESKYGPLRVSQVQKLKILFKEFIGVESESLNDDFLKKVEHPISSIIRHYREESKLVSTYLDPLLIDQRYITPWKTGGESKCQVMEDGRIHHIENALGTVTGRPSGTNMNMLNWPSRGETGSGFVKKKLRNCITAPEGYVMVSIDYAQIEARVIASLAKDENYLKQLWEDFDIHMYWTKRVNDSFPGLFILSEVMRDPEKAAKALKALRKDWKNTWTFPLLYNSSNKSVYENAALLLPSNEIRSKFSEHKFTDLINEFWNDYPKIKPWQEGLGVEMDTNGCIVTPFGQTMWDLKKTEYCNYSSQSAAADICSYAEYRLLQHGIKVGGKKFYTVLNIYDDLTFYVKEDYLDEFLVDAIPIMVDVKPHKNWYLAPLEVEVSVGKSWGNQIDYGTFSSKHLN